MSIEVVKCWGAFKPGNIELPKDSSPLRVPSTSESISTLPKQEGFRFFGSSRDGWSPARVRAANAECWAYQRAARQATIVESAASAKDYEGPEPGSTLEDTRIYTQFKDGKYRYWGVKDLDMTMEEFWARNDPDNLRELIANQDSGPLPASAELTSSKSPSPRPRTASKSKRRQATPDGPKHRVTKPVMVTPASKKGIRKSLTCNIEGRYPEIYEQIQDVSNSSAEEGTVVTNLFGTRWPDKAERSQTISGVNSSTSTPSTTKIAARGRLRKIQSDKAVRSQTISGVNSSTFNPSTTKTPARGRPRKIQSEFIDSSSSNSADSPSSMREDPPKRKRGRPTKEKYPTKSWDLHGSYGSNEKQKRPNFESKAKVTKPKLTNHRPIALSVHMMCTRARGPAENLPRF